MLLNRGLFLYKNKFKKKYYKTEGNPFTRGSVLKVSVASPKKPNSARRAIAKVSLVNRISSLVYIPGIGHNLRKHSLVLVRGGGARDLPMVSYSCIRGRFDLQGVLNRITRRSIYGVKRAKDAPLFKKKFKRI